MRRPIMAVVTIGMPQEIYLNQQRSLENLDSEVVCLTSPRHWLDVGKGRDENCSLCCCSMFADPFSGNTGALVLETNLSSLEKFSTGAN